MDRFGVAVAGSGPGPGQGVEEWSEAGVQIAERQILAAGIERLRGE